MMNGGMPANGGGGHMGQMGGQMGMNPMAMGRMPMGPDQVCNASTKLFLHGFNSSMLSQQLWGSIKERKGQKDCFPCSLLEV